MRTEDGYIIHKCLNGEPEAFGFLVDKYKESIYGFAYSKLLNFHDAEDVTQEVFIKAYQKLRTLRRWDNFHAWLYSITSNLCKMWIRARSRRPDNEFTEDQNPEILEILSIGSYREGLAQESLHESLHEALSSLPEMYRQVLTLYYLSGMNYKEIARFLGASPMTILQRLHRARLQLKEEMLAMMTTDFGAQKLSGGFTFRILEAVKRIKIQPMPRATGLPWGLSLAAGIIITILSLNPRLSILNPASFPMGSPLPVETKVLKAGEIPVDILKISPISVIASKQGGGDGGVPMLPDPQNAALMAAHGEAGTWTKRADMPTARGAMSASAVDGKIYVIGGSLGIGSNMAVVEMYDPKTDTWKRKSDMPTPRAGLSTCVVDGIVYAIGGGWEPPMLPTVEAYDPVTDKWTRKADMPTPRNGPSACAVDGIIYAIGGLVGRTSPVPTVEAYDPKTDTWTKKADMPASVGVVSTSAVDGIIYAIGGGWGGGAAGLSTVFAYNPKTDTWARKADMPTPRLGSSACVVNGIIYAIGGTPFGGGPGLETVEAYDPATDTWTKKANMPTARKYSASSAVDGKLYVIGGVQGQQVLTKVEEYDTGFVPSKETSSIEPKGKLVTAWGEIKSD